MTDEVLLQFLETVGLDYLRLAFMGRALVAVIIIGVVSGVIGAYVVTRGMAFMGDAMAHSVLPGVAVAFLVAGSSGQSLLVGGLAAGVIAALIIGFLTRRGRLAEDTAIGIVFAGMLALGVGLISRTENYTVDLSHVLVGNILDVRESDLALIAFIAATVLVLILLFYKELLLISFDTTLAQTLRLPGEGLRMLLLVLLAVTIVIGIQVVGVALVSAMIVTPAATARLLTKRLQYMMVIAAAIGASGGAIGLSLSWHWRVAPSAAIVLTLTVIFLVTFLFAPRRGYVWSLLPKR